MTCQVRQGIHKGLRGLPNADLNLQSLSVQLTPSPQLLQQGPAQQAPLGLGLAPTETVHVQVFLQPLRLHCQPGRLPVQCLKKKALPVVQMHSQLPCQVLLGHLVSRVGPDGRLGLRPGAIGFASSSCSG